jgi:hypothetical protein
MTDNPGLIAYQSIYTPLCNHVVEVTSWSSIKKDNYGKPILDMSTTRRYKCLLQMNDETKWTNSGATDDFPYIAYVLSVPIGGTDAVPIRVEEQVTVITPAFWASATPRRLGKIQTYPDEHGNMFVMVFGFE